MMIARYSRPEMARIWGDEARHLEWLRVEFAVCEELACIKRIPQADWRKLKKSLNLLIKAGGVDRDRVELLEQTTRHDVIAFTTAVAEKVGPLSRYIHFGLTSSDVLDTALSALIARAGVILLGDIDVLLKTLKAAALKYKNLPTIGRSHGIFAEPTSFGLKFLGWYCEWRRNRERLEVALEDIRYGKLSGAVGVNPHWGPALEERVLARLGLKRELVSTQVLPRDRHAVLLNVFAVCGASLERMAVELRHLQRSEVSEVQEGFGVGQKGSSAMPHKRNPISSENITGCARMLRAYSQAALENVVLWHERDISHSSVERVIMPDATILLDYALVRMNKVLNALVIREDQIKANLLKAGATVYSGHYLLALVEAGASREEAYLWVQECSHKTLDGNGEFLELLSKHSKVRRFLSPAKIRKLGSVEFQLRHVREIFERALKEI